MVRKELYGTFPRLRERALQEHEKQRRPQDACESIGSHRQARQTSPLLNYQQTRNPPRAETEPQHTPGLAKDKHVGRALEGGMRAPLTSR
jgi:hypothetical protein